MARFQSLVLGLRLLFLAVFLTGIWAAYGHAYKESTEGEWARRLPSQVLSNFFKVSDDLYRGAQPTAAGMREIERLGVKTVINLRSRHSDESLLVGTSLNYRHIPMSAASPKSDQITRFIEIVKDKEKGPFFVHCLHGADRTGSMCAVYRVVFQDWKKEDALKEMTRGGFGYHKIWNFTIIPFLKRADLEACKAALKTR
jgi:protein tyrosine phosphatase (PTP) superfamily phosphohydrolase (DUF442 family)